MFGLLPKDQAPLFRMVKSFALGITPHEDGEATVAGSFQTGDAEATPQLAKYLESIDLQGAKSQKVVTPPADVKDDAEQWVTWQMRTDAETLREALAKMKFGITKAGPP